VRWGSRNEERGFFKEKKTSGRLIEGGWFHPFWEKELEIPKVEEKVIDKAGC